MCWYYQELIWSDGFEGGRSVCSAVGFIGLEPGPVLAGQDKPVRVVGNFWNDVFLGIHFSAKAALAIQNLTVQTKTFILH